MHDLRHAHASWLLAGGADLKTVMERMAHDDEYLRFCGTQAVGRLVVEEPDNPTAPSAA